MPESNEEGPAEGFEELAADVLAGDELELDLLLRHAREPDSLSREERAQVEAYLAASPAHRDRARVMTRLAAAGGPLAALGLEEPADVSAETGGGAEIIPLARFSRRAIPLALAASILFALFGAALYVRSISPDQDAPQLAQDEASSTPDATVAPPPSLREDAGTRLAEGATTSEAPDIPPPLEPVLDPDPGSAPGSEDSPPAVVRPQDVASTPSLPTPGATPGATPDEPGVPPTPEPEVFEEGEPILLAALFDAGPLDYAGPAGLDELVRIEGRLRSAPGETGSAFEPLAVTMLAPRHRGLSFEAAPTLYWYVSRATDAVQELAVIDKRSRLPVLKLELAAPETAGIQSVDLAAHGVTLSPGVDYRWVVAVIHDRARRSRDTVASAEIRRVEPSAEQLRALDAAPLAQRAHVLASAGIWYDALDWLSERIARHPEEPRLRLLRADLLAEAGLSEAADFDRRVARSEGEAGSSMR